MNKLPAKWENYSAIGKLITGTRFVAFKVPLAERFNGRLPPDVRPFTPDLLFEEVRRQNSRLGLVIDLTNTKKYYHENLIMKQNVKYKKIFTEGHMVPSAKVKKEFFDTVDGFLKENKDNSDLIGVHCTHGINRTGYLICRYMINKLNIPPEESIKAFNEGRGHNIERQNYIDDLLNLNKKNEYIEDGNKFVDDGKYDKTNAWQNSNSSYHKVPYNNNQYNNQYDNHAYNGDYSHGNYNNICNPQYESFANNDNVSQHYGNIGYQNNNPFPNIMNSSYYDTCNNYQQNMNNYNNGKYFNGCNMQQRRQYDNYEQRNFNNSLEKSHTNSQEYGWVDFSKRPSTDNKIINNSLDNSDHSNIADHFCNKRFRFDINNKNNGSVQKHAPMNRMYPYSRNNNSSYNNQYNHNNNNNYTNPHKNSYNNYNNNYNRYHYNVKSINNNNSYTRYNSDIKSHQNVYKTNDINEDSNSINNNNDNNNNTSQNFNSDDSKLPI